MANGPDKMASPKPAPVRSAKPTASAAPATAPAAKQIYRPREVRQARMSQTFSQVVAVLMRDPNFRNLRLADLEWLVLPPIMAGQWKLGQTSAPAGPAKKQEGAVVIPVAVALWASVSPAIDKRLTENPDGRVDIKPNEWASGDIVWIIAAAGDPRAIPKLLKQLNDTDFKDRPVKLRVKGTDGKSKITTLG